MNKRFPGIWELLRGDVRLFMRDRLAIFLAVILPIVSIPVLLGSIEEATEAGEAKVASRILEIDGPIEMNDLFVPEDRLVQSENPFIDQPQEHEESADAELKLAGSHTPAVIRYRGNDTDSREAHRRLQQVLLRQQDSLQNAQWQDLGIAIEPNELRVLEIEDLSTASARAGNAVGKWLPIMLFLLISMGGLYTALDLFAGERERGTLETLLVSRLNRGTILAARFLLVLGFCLVTAWLALGSLWFGVSKGWIKMLPESGAESLLTLTQLAETAVLCIPLAALLGSLLILTAALAPDLKTGQALSMPVLLVVSALAGVSALPDISLSPLLCVIPISGLALGIRESLTGNLSPMMLAGVFVATSIHAAIGLRIAHRFLQRESILFLSSTTQRRKKGRLGLEVCIGYSLALLLFWFLGQMAMRQDLVIGMLLNQLLFIAGTGLALLAWLGLPLRHTLQIRLPKLRHQWLAIVIGISAPCMSWLVMETQSIWVPVNEATTGMEGLDMDLGLGQTLILFALLPAVCEEILFRGTLQGLLRKSTRPWVRCVVIGLLFGFFHLSVARILPTGMLGIALGLTAWWSRSLIVPIMIHLLHNASVLWLEHTQRLTELPPKPWLIGGASLFISALWLMSRGKAR